MARGPCGPDNRYRPGEQPLLDRYSVAHAAAGVVYGAVGLPWWWALGAGVFWELVENPLKDRFPEVFPDSCHDTLGNAAGDLLAVMVGYGLGRHGRDKWNPIR